MRTAVKKKRLPMSLASTPLERHVLRWINKRARDYDSGVTGVLEDLQKGGCSSGYVTHLIYYTDTTRFFKRYRKEISSLLKEAIENSGEPPSMLFKRAGWDDEDPLADDTCNQNILAWFGFEETAYNLHGRWENA